MNNFQYAFKLKFNVCDIINDKWQRPFIQDLFFVKNYDNVTDWQNIVNEKFLDLCNKKLPIYRIMVFNKPRVWCSTDAHIDPGVPFALNVIFNDSNAKMQWLQPISTIPKPVSYTTANTPYQNYHDGELNLMHEECLQDDVWIVRTDVPHRIKIGDTARTCVSLRFTTQVKDWDQAYNLFRELDWI